MAVSYKKLWKLLIDKDLKKKDLAEMAHVSTYTIGKLISFKLLAFFVLFIDVYRRFCYY